jgi:hypothetical protein
LSAWRQHHVLLAAALLSACGGGDVRADPPLRRQTDPWASEAPAELEPDAGIGEDDTTDAGASAQARACELDAAPGTRITLARLFTEMVDLLALTRLPDPPYTSRFASSHDRASDAAQPGEQDWFANHDFVALAPGETVTLLDAQGPGVITRIWSAGPGGVLRVYIDGSEQPAIEAELKGLLEGDVEPFSPPFAFVAEGGHNLYFPISFARSCRITLAGEDDAVYYHISYRQYPDGTDVEPFGPESLRASECVRELVASRLSDLAPDSDAVDLGQPLSFHLSTAHPEQPAVIAADASGGLLWQLRMWPGNTDPELLRATILSITFDDEETVRVPLGDFFSSGFAVREVNSLPVGVDPDGAMTSRWPMPFEREARIALESSGAAENDAALDVTFGAAPWTEHSLYFHAQWHAPETFPSEPFSDWNLATLEGTGLYAGNVLNVVNRAVGWWGEGDEKIYVDGEAFPSHFGTGTEDYYGYAYCSNQPFTTAYIGQPLGTSRKNFGYTSLYRFHVFDPIPFQSSLRFDLEVRHWGDPVDVTYDAVSFWYGRPGSRMTGTPADAESFRIPELGVPVPEDTLVGAYRCGE